jgi:LemA protein
VVSTAERWSQMNWIWTVVGLTGGLALGSLVSTYNRLVSGRNACSESWADISTELKRRSDLVPNLVETVKGYASHERDTLKAAIYARKGSRQA